MEGHVHWRQAKISSNCAPLPADLRSHIRPPAPPPSTNGAQQRDSAGPTKPHSRYPPTDEGTRQRLTAVARQLPQTRVPAAMVPCIGLGGSWHSKKLTAVRGDRYRGCASSLVSGSLAHTLSGPIRPSIPPSSGQKGGYGQSSTPSRPQPRPIPPTRCFPSIA